MSSQSIVLQIAPVKAEEATVNLLPCNIPHNGPVNARPDLWNPHALPNPSTGSNSTLESHFRGRRLEGEVISLGKNDVGHILRPTTENLVASMEDEEETEQVAQVEVLAEFSEVVVWGHEAIVEDGQVARGLKEWREWAAAVHGMEEEEEKENQ